MSDKPITIRLTVDAARLIYGIVDGAGDAGSCEEGLSEDEHDACRDVLDQIMRGLKRINPTNPLRRERNA